MESSAVQGQTQQQLTSPRLPLAVYREVVAHLRQVEGVDAHLIMGSIHHDPAAKFDYAQSQVAALQIDFSGNIAELSNQRVVAILEHYAQRYYPWSQKLVGGSESPDSNCQSITTGTSPRRL